MPEKIIRILVNKGADLEAQQHWGWTPLMRAVVEGTCDEVVALVNVGANPDCIFPSNTMPEFLAGRTLLMATLATVEAEKKLSILIKAGADVYAQDMYGDTVLTYCIASDGIG
jgi:ankyrin repeat protein